MYRSIYKIFSLIFLSINLNYAQSEDIAVGEPHPQLTTADRIAAYGYQAETYTVETKDNYVLTLFRIPFAPGVNTRRKFPILLLHGIFSSSDAFVLSGPNDALAFNLANAGYDVWLGNDRGNKYSRRNTHIPPSNSQFWDFSFHEMGIYDLPAMIDFILLKTKQKGLHFVGFSQGCAALAVMLSIETNYNAFMKTTHLLAPATYIGHSSMPGMILLAPVYGIPGEKSYDFQNIEAVRSNPIFIQKIYELCRTGGILEGQRFCRELLLLITDSSTCSLNQTVIANLPHTHPAGTSTNCILHYLQNYHSKDFRMYNRPTKKNYFKLPPMKYPLHNIETKIWIYYSEDDSTVNFKDVEKFAMSLQNVEDIYLVPRDGFDHLSFVFDKEVKILINDRIIKVCDKYENSH